MAVPRRAFLGHAAVASAVAVTGCRARSSSDHALAAEPVPVVDSIDPQDRWAKLRRQFQLSADYIHMSTLLIASHPTRVREAIERYRQEIDRDPVLTLQQHNRPRQ